MLRALRSIFNIVVNLFSSCFLLVKENKNLTCTASRYAAILTLTLMLFACNSSSQDKSKKDSLINLPKSRELSPAEIEQLNKACNLWYDTVLYPKGFNGGMIVAKDGNIIFEKYNGTLHLPGNDTITASTPMQIASTSKTFTAMAVLKLQQDGKLNIDETFATYFPEFNYPDITIRNLLSHRSGLPDYMHFLEAMKWDKKQIATNKDVLDQLIAHKNDFKNLFKPGTKFNYSNTNFALLALLVEKVSGKPFPDFLRETFFAPLQMNNTFVFTIADTLKAAPSYDWKGRPMDFNFLDAVYGDKNVYTTPRDLLIWDQALRSNTLFTPETLEQAYAGYSNEKPGIRNYGLGWRMNIYPTGKKMIYHNGWWHGCNAAFVRLIDEGGTIIIIGNRFTRAVYHTRELANLFGEYAPIEEDEGEGNKVSDSVAMAPKKVAAPKKKTTKSVKSVTKPVAKKGKTAPAPAKKRS